MTTRTHPEVSNTTQKLIDLLVARDRAGRAKYGTTLDRDDLAFNDWLQHMAEELLDGAGYALAAKRANVDPSGSDEYLAYLEAAIDEAGFVIKHDPGTLGDSNFRLEPKGGSTPAQGTDLEQFRVLAKAWEAKIQDSFGCRTTAGANHAYEECSYALLALIDASAEGGSDAQDAARYRWLRKHFRFANDNLRELRFDPAIDPNDGGVPEDLDQEIDRAVSNAHNAEVGRD